MSAAAAAKCLQQRSTNAGWKKSSKPTTWNLICKKSTPIPAPFECAIVQKSLPQFMHKTFANLLTGLTSCKLHENSSSARKLQKFSYAECMQHVFYEKRVAAATYKQ